MESYRALASHRPFEWKRSGGHLLTLFLGIVCRGNSPGVEGCTGDSQVTSVAGIGTLAPRRGASVPWIARGGQPMKRPPRYMASNIEGNMPPNGPSNNL